MMIYKNGDFRSAVYVFGQFMIVLAILHACLGSTDSEYSFVVFSMGIHFNLIYSLLSLSFCIEFDDVYGFKLRLMTRQVQNRD